MRGAARAHVEETLADLAPGVTEISLSPALDEPEIHAADPAAAGRVDDLDLAVSGDLKQAVVAASATLIGYRALRAAQRSRS